MASGKEGWVPSSDDTTVELDPPQLIPLPDGQVQIRFESFMVPEGATEIVPTFTLSCSDMDRFADSLKFMAAQTPASTARN